MGRLNQVLEESKRTLEGTGGLFLNRNADQVFASSAKLQKSVADGRDKTGAHLADIGIDTSKFRKAAELQSLRRESNQTLRSVNPTDVEGFLRTQYQNIIVTAIEGAKTQTSKYFEKTSQLNLDKEWENKKAELLEELGYLTVSWNPQAHIKSSDSPHRKQQLNSKLPRFDAYHSVIENLVRSISQDKSFRLVREFQQLCANLDTNNIHHAEIQDCWDILATMLQNAKRFEYENTLSSPKTVAMLRVQAKRFLEEQFYRAIEQTVRKSNIQRTGDVSALSTITNFVRIRHSRDPPKSLNLDNAIIYYCVRCGKLAEAEQQARKLGKKEIQDFIKQYERDEQSVYRGHGLNRNRQQVLEYYNNQQNGWNADLDPALRTLCIVFGQMECSNLSDIASLITSTQDFMWLKLATIHDEETSQVEFTMAHLQKSLQQWGAAHFNPKGNNPLLYTHVLLLSQQFDEAIRYLDSTGQYKVEAVHLGCTLYYYGLLKVPNNAFELRFNFEKMISQFVRQFGPSDPHKYVQYFFLFKDPDAIIANVSSFICQTHELSLLGFNQQNGQQSSDGIVFLLPEELVTRITSRVADEFNSSNNVTLAITLYNLAGEYDKVLEIVNNQLGNLLTRAGSERQKAEKIAKEVYQEYSKGGEKSIIRRAASPAQVRAFIQMMQLIAFFENVQSESPNLNDAIQIQQDLGILPFTPQTIASAVQEFSSLDDCVRRNFTEILTTTMEVLSYIYQHASRSEAQQAVEYARCIATFIGMIPFRLPSQASRVIAQICAQMN